MLTRLPTQKQRRTATVTRAVTREFVADARAAGFTPHVAQNATNRKSAIDGRTTRHGGYGISQRIR
jgi:hypothetical protein